MTRFITMVAAVLGGSALSLANLGGGSTDGSRCTRENCPAECCVECPCERCECCCCDGAQAAASANPTGEPAACCPASCCDAAKAAK